MPTIRKEIAWVAGKPHRAGFPKCNKSDKGDEPEMTINETINHYQIDRFEFTDYLNAEKGISLSVDIKTYDLPDDQIEDILHGFWKYKRKAEVENKVGRKLQITTSFASCAEEANFWVSQVNPNSASVIIIVNDEYYSFDGSDHLYLKLPKGAYTIGFLVSKSFSNKFYERPITIDGSGTIVNATVSVGKGITRITID